MELTKSTCLTALILTKNEEPNLKRVLDKLSWLEQVVILDSFSSDSTLEIARSYTNTIIHQRAFDTHATQWNYGLSLLNSKWVLSLDADYVLTDEFISETKKIIEHPECVAYITKFKFLVFGQKLLGDNTMPRPVLFELSHCTYYDDGHTQRLTINGKTGEFDSYILHDDRKSLSRWLSNQDGYAIKESKKLINVSMSEVSLTSKIRKTKILAPVFVFFQCLFFKGLIFNGWTGWHYTLQRTMVEMLLALRLIEEENLSKELEQQQNK
jgi:glycosyltransferase involved in cell wall biosynthesis